MRKQCRTIVGMMAIVVGAWACPNLAFAQSPEELKRQIDDMQRQLQQMRDQLDQMQRKQQMQAAPPPPAPAAAAAAGGEFIRRKPGDGVTFMTRGGEVSLYGQLDLSLDSATKGIAGLRDDNGNGPPGKLGWQPAISTNLSYLGVRGFQSLPQTPTRFVYQLEAQVDISVTPGASQSNSNTSGQVKSALFSRNSFIGLSSKEWGAVKIGKTDAPYKNSTARMNEFSGMVGDYSAIIGNTGGDNRVEFGTRLAHAIWYESPNWSGVSFSALWAPGQNRADDSSNISSGEPECAGGNVPGSGGLPVACNDGAYSDAFSTAITYNHGPLYLSAAYELHKKVNRTSDLPAFDPRDVADEKAFKVGMQYRFPTKTTLSLIWEDMKRDVDAALADQNERQRSGYWVALSQVIDPRDSVHFGWAHANKAQGDAGQHNPDASQADANGFFPNADNRANMYTIAWKHLVDHNLMWYLNYATTLNNRFAHYDLGAGGRAVTTDCHDGSNPDSSGFDPNGGAPHCWTGAHLQAVSVGLKYRF